MPRALSLVHAGSADPLTVLALRMPSLLTELARFLSLECLGLDLGVPALLLPLAIACAKARGPAKD